jgi:adenosylcobinamide-GDP ribazoletransferase
MKGLLPALQFLTIIPVRIAGITEADIARSAAFFPAAGALQGLILLIPAILLSGPAPADITAAAVIVVSVLCNGGFHLDGLSDTFDALAVKASGNVAADRERRLEVMKDSRAGALGVVSICLVLLLQFVLLTNILRGPEPLAAWLIVFLTPVFGRWAMVPAMYHGRAARKDGLGRIFIDGADLRILLCAYVFAACLFVCAAVTLGISGHGPAGALLFIILPAGHIFALVFEGLCRRSFGGLTGDTLGALSELAEIFFLTGAYIWQQHFI